MDLVRNQTIHSSTPTVGTSVLVSTDVASMHPSSIMSMNIGKSFLGQGAKYYTTNNYPFEVIKITQKKDGWDFTNVDVDVITNSHSFDRKIEAEKYRLSNLSRHYNILGDKENVEKYEKLYNNIEEDYPEWVI